MFLLICKLYICIQNVFGHIFYSSRLHLYWQFWKFEVQKLTYMLILAAGGSSPYLSSVGGWGVGQRFPKICFVMGCLWCQGGPRGAFWVLWKAGRWYIETLLKFRKWPFPQLSSLHPPVFALYWGRRASSDRPQCKQIKPPLSVFNKCIKDTK